MAWMQQEYDARAENPQEIPDPQAGFPQLKYLQDLIREDLPLEAQERLPLLERLDFIKDGRNLIFVRNPGPARRI